MDFYKNNKFRFVMLLFLIFGAAIYFYHSVAGLFLILALLLFGSISLFWKESHIKISCMVLLVVLALLNASLGLNFGIDFSGGTRIPIVLEHPVTSDVMSSLVQTIKTRASVLGLTEAHVFAVGDSEIYVELPTSDSSTVQSVEQTLSHQGVFQGIVDGRLALSGDNIYSTSIAQLGAAQMVQPGSRIVPDWGVQFNVDNKGAQDFADAAKGKSDYPIYMFLDRPTDAVLFYDPSSFRSYVTDRSSQKETLKALKQALMLNGTNIPVYILGSNLTNVTPMTNKTLAIVSANLSQTYKDRIKALGFKLMEVDESQMAPRFEQDSAGDLLLSQLGAVGLLTAPILSGQVTGGIPTHGFMVTGDVNGSTAAIKAQLAEAQVKSITSILKGGSLPVQISLGSRTTLPASIGSQFLQLSLIGVLGSLILISALIGLRYKNLNATMPIVLVSLGELIILFSILGSFTIDLPAMAGIIAAIGTGVDAQIVIADELTKKDDTHTTHEKVDLAFGIIRTNAIVAIFSMIPLLFSGLVEVIGFAISTILGALLGYMLTRPTYAAIVETILDNEKKKSVEEPRTQTSAMKSPSSK